MTLTSTYDHRVIQGAQSGEYLQPRRRAARRRRRVLRNGVRAARRDAPRCAASRRARTARRRPVREREEPVAADIPGLPSEEMLRAIAAGMAIVSAYRRHGHLGATLDPLGTEPPNDPSLDPATYGLTPAMMQAIPASVLNVKLPGKTLADVLPEAARRRTARRSRTRSSTSRTRASASGCASTSRRACTAASSRRSAACKCSSA